VAGLLVNYAQKAVKLRPNYADATKKLDVVLAAKARS